MSGESVNLPSSRGRRGGVDAPVIIENDAVIPQRRIGADEAEPHVCRNGVRIARGRVAIAAAAGHLDDQALVRWDAMATGWWTDSHAGGKWAASSMATAS